MKERAWIRKAFSKFSEKLEILRPKYALFTSLVKKTFKFCLIFFPFLFLIILCLNLFFPKNTFLLAKENVLANPKSYFAHFTLGQQFFNVNDYDMAQQEFALSQSSTDSPQLSLTAFMINQPNNIKKNILYWQKLTEEIPTYRDAYIKLSILNKKIYNDLEANNLLKRALEIDPNNEVFKQLVRF